MERFQDETPKTSPIENLMRERLHLHSGELPSEGEGHMQTLKMLCISVIDAKLPLSTRPMIGATAMNANSTRNLYWREVVFLRRGTELEISFIPLHLSTKFSARSHAKHQKHILVVIE